LEYICFSLIFIFAILGLPIFVVMSLFALTAFGFADEPLTAVPTAIYSIASSPTLLTVPLFTLAGYMMAESGSPQRLLRFARASLGWLPGGVAIVSLVICAFFTAFTGASGVTIIALGGLLFPILCSEGYSEKFSLGLITTSGSLGLLFPPSLPIILYGLVAKTDIDQLFRAGILPGILLVLVLSAYSIYKNRNSTKKFPKRKFEGIEFVASFKGALPELILPVGILIGIYGGFTTVTEASAFTAVYVLIIEFFVYKDLKFSKDFPDIVSKCMSLVGAILLILCCALGMTNYLVDEEIPIYRKQICLSDLFKFISIGGWKYYGYIQCYYCSSTVDRTNRYPIWS